MFQPRFAPFRPIATLVFLLSPAFPALAVAPPLHSTASRQTLEGHRDGIFSVAVSPRDRWLASAGRDSAVKVWDLTTGQVHRTLKGHSGQVLRVGFSPDGKILASA